MKTECNHDELKVVKSYTTGEDVNGKTKICSVTEKTCVNCGKKFIEKNIDDESASISYRNIYISHFKNNYVLGLNTYKSKEEAKANQMCPAGYMWHSAAPSREWALNK